MSRSGQAARASESTRDRRSRRRSVRAAAASLVLAAWLVAVAALSLALSAGPAAATVAPAGRATSRTAPVDPAVAAPATFAPPAATDPALTGAATTATPTGPATAPPASDTGSAPSATPSLTITTGSADFTPGSTVLASATGWAPRYGIGVYVLPADFGFPPEWAASSRPVETIAPSEGGGVPVAVTAPDGVGDYLLVACQLCGEGRDARVAQAAFTVRKPTGPAVLGLLTASSTPSAPVVATGTGWASNEPVTVFPGRDDLTDPASRLGAPVQPTAAGGFAETLTAPAAPGRYTLFACQACGTTAMIWSTSAFTVTAPPPVGLVLGRPAAPPGGTVQATGSGWTPGRAVSVFAAAGDSADPASALAPPTVASANGAFVATLTAPVEPGQYALFACQACGTAAMISTSRPFAVTAPPTSLVFTLGRQTSLPGGTVRAVGSGWAAGAPVQIYAAVGDVAGGAAMTSTSVHGRAGRFGVTFVVPARPGSYRFVACQDCQGGAGSRFAGADFTVLAPVGVAATLTVAPPRSSPRGTVLVSGAHWAAGAPVSIFGAQVTATDPGAALAASSPTRAGAFTVSLPAPAGGGRYTFFACQHCLGGPDFRSATAAFRVIGAPGHPVLRLGTSRAPAGRPVTVTGSGWVPGEQVRLYADRGDAVQPDRALAVAPGPGVRGTFTVTFAAPDAPGTYTVYACQDCAAGADASSATAELVVVAPPARSAVWLVTGGVGLLAAAAALLLLVHLIRRRPRTGGHAQLPRFEPHPDTTLDVGVGALDGPALPTLRLVVHAGSTHTTSPEADR